MRPMATSPDPQDCWPSAGLPQGRLACTTLLRQALLGMAPMPLPANPRPNLPESMPITAPAPWAATRQLWLADPDFTDWPLDEPAVLNALSAWLRQGGRQVQLVGLAFDTTARERPRLARWRRDWSHAIAVWTPCDGVLPPPLHGLLAAPLRLQWQDSADWRMRCTTDIAHAHRGHLQNADFLQRCESAWPVTTLGL